jgi:glutaredoxin 3
MKTKHEHWNVDSEDWPKRLVQTMAVNTKVSLDMPSINIANENVDEFIKSGRVVIFSKSYCPGCAKVKALFNSLGVQYAAYELDMRQDGSYIQDELEKRTGRRTVPNVFIDGTSIGGCDLTRELHKKGKLLPLINGEKATPKEESCCCRCLALPF